MTLLLLEGDARLGAVTRDLLSTQWSVTWVTSIAQAREELGSGAFDACIFVRKLADGDATELISWMRAQRDATPVLMLTAVGQVDDRVSGLDAGANDYMVKPFEFAELSARLRALTRDYSRKGSAIEIGGGAYHPEHSSIESPYTGRIMLTERENALLRMLAEHPDTAFSRAQLLGSVFAHQGSETTVDTYVHHECKKTDRDLIQTVRGVGYQLGTPA